MPKDEITAADAQNILTVLLCARLGNYMSSDTAVALIAKLDRIANPGSYDRG